MLTVNHSPTKDSSPNIGIDNVTFTFLHKSVDHDLLLAVFTRICSRYAGGSGTFSERGARNHFENGWVFSQGKESASFFYGGNKGRACFDFRGSFCALADWRFFRFLYWFLRRVHGRITRLDIAADFFDGSIDVLALHDQYDLDPDSVLTCKSGNWPRLGWIDKGQGASVYIGSKTSAREINVYEKGKQLGSECEGWVRIEVRFMHDKNSPLDLDMLLPVNWWPYIWGLGPWFAGKVPPEAHLRREYKRRRVHGDLNARLQRQIRHVRQNYGKFLFFLSTLVGAENAIAALITNAGDWSGLDTAGDWRSDEELIMLLMDTILKSGDVMKLDNDVTSARRLVTGWAEI